MFVTDVANARKLKQEDHKIYADAHIFTSNQAKKVGLIDEVATISTAKFEVETLSKVENPVWSQENKMDKFMEKMLSNTIANISTNLNGLIAY